MPLGYTQINEDFAKDAEEKQAAEAAAKAAEAEGMVDQAAELEADE